MYLADMHTHTYYSPDSREPMEAMARAAVYKRLDRICFTDHCDIMELKESEDGVDWKARRAEFEGIRDSHGKKVRFLCGIEVGEATHDIDATERILSENKFDFILASMHNLKNADDFYFIEYKSKAGCKEYIKEYLDELTGVCRWGNFDSLAHITYPLRYMVGREKIDIDFSDFTEELREIFRLLVQNGKSLELNTSGIQGIYGEFMPYPALLDIYRDCGGELVTIGSDAHRASRVAAGLAEGYELLAQHGFKYITVYENRIPEHIKI